MACSFPTCRLALLGALLIAISVPVPLPAADDPGLARVELLEVRYPDFSAGPSDHSDPGSELREEGRIATNLARLELDGRRTARAARAAQGLEPRFSWPIVDLGSGQFSSWGISNFVDQDPTWPNQTMDYACGDRTYDTSDGYNHTGIDMYLWPFPWRMKDQGRIAIVAAAPGQIIDRIDGEPDESCSLSGGLHNTIVLEHPDLSRSYYRHMKNGSVTAKQIGDAVVRGEYLGLVASSGNSTGPHLHFAARNAAEELVEPYAGFCNIQANGFTSWWLDQPAYRDYALLDLATHWATPTDPPCPEPENPRFKRLFDAGDQVIVGAYFRDPTPDFGATLRVFRPNGSLYAQWSFNHLETRSAAAVFWQFDLPSLVLPSMIGRWTLRATYSDAQGDTVIEDRAFWFRAIFADDFERYGLTSAGWTVPFVLP